jgi:PAT family beta-lactamase induction signal transducer AmpG
VKAGTIARFSLLGTLYFAQGLPFGFFVKAVPVLLRRAGFSLTQIGLTALLVLPWAFKFAWAPLVDRHYLPRIGRRRTWILAMQLAAVIVLSILAGMPGSGDLDVLIAATFVLNLVAATQDIATDGLAVELLPPDERGFANGLQVAGYRIGMIVGGAVLLALWNDIGTRAVFGVMAALTALSSAQVLLLRESTLHAEAATRPAKHFFSLPGAGRVLALVMLYKLGESMGQNMLTPLLVDLKLTNDDIALIGAAVGFTAGMAGALTGGALVGYLGRRRALIAFGFGQVLTVAGYAYLAFTSPSLLELGIWAGVEHFASGMATAALFTSMMDWSRPAFGGTDYTVMASAVVIATALPAPLAGALGDAIGYGPYFLVAAGVCAIGIAGVVALFPRGTFPPDD